MCCNKKDLNCNENQYTVMRRLTTGICSEKSVVWHFCCCVNIIECTYTNLDSTDWRSRTNEEVRQLYGELDIVTEIKKRKIEVAGTCGEEE